MSFSLLFVLVSWISVIPCPTRAQGLCRRLKFSPPVNGYALQGHVIKNISLNIYLVENIPSRCNNYCTMESKCVSFNIGPPIKDTVLCQLNDADRMQHFTDLQAREGFMYRGTENPCSSSPCLHNATCLNGFTARGYVCKCQDGYGGEQCERGDDECTSNPCLNNGTCKERPHGYSCSCPLGYTGIRCETGLFVDVNSSCAGLHFKASKSNGIIKSNMDGKNVYGDNLDCRWHFTSNDKLELVFLHFETDSSADYVNVYDGKSAASPLIGTFSEYSLPSPIMSSSDELYVTFTTDGIKPNADGFLATYRDKSIAHEISPK